MKKLKLLSSLSALVLVLSVGACNSGSSDDDLSAEDSSSSSSVVEEITLNNYTLSFSFVDATGAASTIPEYATAYVIGSWDSWSQFIPLTETEGRYSTTFSTIKEGSYTYKVVEWYTDETVDWSNCVEITTTDQTVVVNASDGDNFTNTITHTLSAELAAPLTDEEIANSILTGIAGLELEYLGNIGWEAYHAEEYEYSEGTIMGFIPYSDEESTSIYMTSKGEDENAHDYGSFVYDDNGTVSCKFIVDGQQYIYDGDYDSYEVKDWDDSFPESLDDYFESLEQVEGILEAGLDAWEWSVTTSMNDGTYTLEVSETTNWGTEEETDIEVDTYTYVTDLDFNLIGIGYCADDEVDGIESYFVEEATLDEVEETMVAFNIKAWEPVEDVADIFARISESNNFCLTIEYYDWYSGYYEDADQLEADYQSGDLTVYGHDYFVDLTYTEDAIMMTYYYSYTYWYYGLYSDIELYVNDYENNQILCYWVNYPDDEYADIDYTDLYVGDVYEGGTWQDMMWSPLDLVESASRFVKGDTTTGKYGEQIAYTIDNLDIDFLNLLCNALFDCGNWLCYYYSYFVYYAATYYSYYNKLPNVSSTFYADYGEFDLSAYYFWEWGWADETSSTGYSYQLEYDSVSVSIYNVDRAYIPSTYASYLA